MQEIRNRIFSQPLSEAERVILQSRSEAVMEENHGYSAILKHCDSLASEGSQLITQKSVHEKGNYELILRWSPSVRSDHDLSTISISRGVKLTATPEGDVQVSYTGRKLLRDVWVPVENNLDYVLWRASNKEKPSLEEIIDFTINTIIPLRIDEPRQQIKK